MLRTVKSMLTLQHLTIHLAEAMKLQPQRNERMPPNDTEILKR